KSWWPVGLSPGFFLANSTPRSRFFGYRSQMAMGSMSLRFITKTRSAVPIPPTPMWPVRIFSFAPRTVAGRMDLYTPALADCAVTAAAAPAAADLMKFRRPFALPLALGDWDIFPPADRYKLPFGY